MLVLRELDSVVGIQDFGSLCSHPGNLELTASHRSWSTSSFHMTKNKNHLLCCCVRTIVLAEFILGPRTSKVVHTVMARTL